MRRLLRVVLVLAIDGVAELLDRAAERIYPPKPAAPPAHITVYSTTDGIEFAPVSEGRNGRA